MLKWKHEKDKADEMSPLVVMKEKIYGINSMCEIEM